MFPKIELKKAIAKVEAAEKAREEHENRKRVLEEEHGWDGGSDDEDNSMQPGDKKGEMILPKGNKRQFASRMRSTTSGPGTLPPDPTYNTSPTYGRYGSNRGSNRGGNRFQSQPYPVTDNEIYTKVIAMASNLPPRMNQKDIEQLFTDFPELRVIKKIEVDIHPIKPSPGGYGPAIKDRNSITAYVEFGDDASSTSLGVAISKMSNKKYLGWGYYLHLDRFLGEKKEPERSPFGGRWVTIKKPKFAPPAALGGRAQSQEAELEVGEKLTVTAYPPPDAKTLRLIHITIDGVIRGGVPFEAALMEDSRVQKQERFAWLYDSRHPLARYYRWKLHQMVTGGSSVKEIFTGFGEWVGPKPFPDEYAFGPHHVTLDASPVGDDENDDSSKKIDNYSGYGDKGSGILPPSATICLQWLLATIGRPVIGSAINTQIAAPSVFAVDHGEKSLDEVVHILVSNVLAPYRLSTANPNYDPPRDGTPYFASAATLDALRVVADVCSVTKQAGGRSWKYPKTIGNQLRERKVFEHLEMLPTSKQMGRVTREEFRDWVNFLIAHWKEIRMMDPEDLEHFSHAFNWRVDEESERSGKKRKMEQSREKAETYSGMVIGGEADDDATANADDAIDLYGDDTNHREQDLLQRGQHPTQSGKNPLQVETGSHQRDGRDIRGASNPEDDSEQGHRVTSSETSRETAAAQAKRMRLKAEDMFASDGE